MSEQKSAVQREQEAKLVRRCRRGDREAFARLMERYQKQIYNFTYRMLGNDEEAADLTQDIFVAAFRGLNHFRAEARFSTWLYRIALNRCRNRIRYLARRNRFGHRGLTAPEEGGPGGDNIDRLSDTGPSPEQWLVARELAAAVQLCLGRLPPPARQILVLRDIQGFSYEELSEMLSLNPGTVKSRLHRARMALQKCLAGKLG